MKVIRISIYQNMCNFKEALTFDNKTTYPLPPYSTVIGMIHNACDFEEYVPMDISVQGTFSTKVVNLSHNYTFSPEKFEKDREKTYFSVINENNNKKTGLIRGTINTELLVNLNLVIHIKLQDETMIEEVYNKLLYPNKFLSLGRNEDIIKIEEVKIVNVEMKENVHQNIPTYIPEKYNVIKGTKYRLPKDYIIIENIIKKKNVKFRKFNFISCYYANNFYTDTFVDEDNYNLFLA